MGEMKRWKKSGEGGLRDIMMNNGIIITKEERYKNEC